MRDKLSSKRSLDAFQSAVRNLRSEGAGVALLALLALYMLFGGGSRADIWSLAFLRPLGAVAFIVGLSLLSAQKIRGFRAPLIFAAAILSMIALQLLPLPPSLWASLPGREPFAQAAALTGVAGMMRPISLYPSATENAFFAMLLPVSILLFYVSASPTYRRLSLWAVLIFALLSSLIGVAQLGADSYSPLYFYDIANHDAPVGLFANRNHQAVLLAITPPLLVFATQAVAAKARWPIYLAAGLWIFFALLVLATGSRAGVTLFTLASMLCVFAAPRKALERTRVYRKLGKRWAYLAPVLILAFVGGLASLATRDAAVSRLFGQTINEDMRKEIYGTTLRMIRDFMPFGGGGGGLPDVYSLYESAQDVTINYVNHAHNDFLEIAFEYGLIGVLLMIAGIGWLAVRAVVVYRSSSDSVGSVAARASSIAVLILLLASVVDYPMRTPALVSVAVILVATLFGVRTAHNDPKIKRDAISE